VKLRDEVFQRKPILWKAKLLGIPFGPSKKIDRPTTSNIVGNLDHFNPLFFHRRKEYVIHVDEPESSEHS